LKPNRPLKAKLGGGWEAKRARSRHVSSITINHRRMALLTITTTSHEQKATVTDAARNAPRAVTVATLSQDRRERRRRHGDRTLFAAMMRRNHHESR